MIPWWLQFIIIGAITVSVWAIICWFDKKYVRPERDAMNEDTLKNKEG